MVFNSYIFILAFLPLVVLVYFIINRVSHRGNGQAGLVWLLVSSLVFYAYEIPAFLMLLLASIIVNYVVVIGLTKLKQRKLSNSKVQKTMVAIGIVLNLLPLIYFKYSNFILNSIESFFDVDWEVEVLLPLGISFFTFVQIAYIVDCYRSEKGFDYTLLEYAVYVAFFPKITMGPIVLHTEIMPQLRDVSKKKADYNNLSQGIYAFVLGLAKKVLIADVLAKFVNAGFQDVDGLNTATALVVMLSYTLQLYFDFSGYCDMAVGAARMLNIELPYNFNSPYKSQSISEFWDRWHMTLTRFFTRYVYIPLGGSRRGSIRTYVNTMIVFLLSGLWHGANWTFVFWGFLHGIFMVMERIGRSIWQGSERVKENTGKFFAGIKWCVTFVLINITWVFFRANSIGEGFLFIKKIFSGGWKCQQPVIEIFDKLIEVRLLKRVGLENVIEASVDITIWGILILLVIGNVFLSNTQEKMAQKRYTWLRSLITIVLMVWSIVSLSDVSEFLYFNF